MGCRLVCESNERLFDGRAGVAAGYVARVGGGCRRAQPWPRALGILLCGRTCGVLQVGGGPFELSLNPVGSCSMRRDAVQGSSGWRSARSGDLAAGEAGAPRQAAGGTGAQPSPAADVADGISRHCIRKVPVVCSHLGAGTSLVVVVLSPSQGYYRSVSACANAPLARPAAHALPTAPAATRHLGSTLAAPERSPRQSATTAWSECRAWWWGSPDPAAATPHHRAQRPAVVSTPQRPRAGKQQPVAPESAGSACWPPQ